MTRRVALAISTLAALAGGCGESPSSPSGSPSSTTSTYLTLTSNPGDQIGDGFTQHVGLAEGTFSAQVDQVFGGKQSVSLSVRPKDGTMTWWWDLRFTTPMGEPLKVGTFENLHRWPGDGAQAGMDFSGTGRGCSFLTGRLVISEYTPGEGRTPNRLRVSFEQRCDSASTPLSGEFLIVANPWR